MKNLYISYSKAVQPEAIAYLRSLSIAYSLCVPTCEGTAFFHCKGIKVKLPSFQSFALFNDYNDLYYLNESQAASLNKERGNIKIHELRASLIR